MESIETWWRVFRYLQQRRPGRPDIGCPTNRLMTCLITGRVGKKAKDRLKAHILVCESCLFLVVKVAISRSQWDKTSEEEKAHVR